MNEPKFNSKNRIFLSCIEGNLRTASGKCMIKTPWFCCCLPSERRNILWLLPDLNTSVFFLPKVDLMFPVKANQRKQEDILFGVGRPRKERREQETSRTPCALPLPLWPVYVFIASQFQFTGSPRKESQVGRWDWEKNSEKQNTLGSLFNLGGNSTPKGQLISGISPQARIGWYLPSLGTRMNLWRVSVTSSKWEERGC